MLRYLWINFGTIEYRKKVETGYMIYSSIDNHESNKNFVADI